MAKNRYSRLDNAFDVTLMVDELIIEDKAGNEVACITLPDDRNEAMREVRKLAQRFSFDVSKATDMIDEFFGEIS